LGLRAQPGVIPRDIVRAQPVVWEDPADPDVDLGEWVANGRPIEVFPRKIGSAESYREGKQDQTLSYTLYADHRRGRAFPLTEKDRIWLEEAGTRRQDGTPDYSTALTVDSVILYNDERVAEIQAGRTY
jgi:hypothetical protein